jgi:uncharacterized protein DUF6603
VAEDTKGRDLFVSIFSVIRNQFAGVVSLVEDDAARAEAFQQLGIATSSAVPDSSSAQTALAKLDNQLATEAGFAATAAAVVVLATAVAEVVNAPDAGVAAQDIAYGLLQLYSTTSIRVRGPEVWALFRAAGFVTDIGFDFGAMVRFLDNTGSYLSGIVDAPSEERKADNWSILLGAAASAVALFLPNKKDRPLNFQVLYGWDPDPASTHPNADTVLRRMVSIQARLKQKDAGTEERVVLTMAVVPPSHGGWGLYGAVSGAAAWTIPIGTFWELKLEGAITDGVEFSIGQQPFFHAGSAADPSIKATFRRSDSAKGVASVGDPGGTHLEFDKLSLTGTLAASGQSIVLRTKDSALVIDFGSDGFLSHVLPRRMRLESDIGMGFDSKRGFFVDGGTKLEATIPINKSLFGIQVEHLTLVLKFSVDGPNGRIEIELSGAIGYSAPGGAFSGSVDRIGIRFDLKFGGNGNAGLGDLAVGFKPPNGVGIAVNAGICKGGGYLYFDPDKGEYAGIVDLKIGPVEVKAIGLLSTKFPDGTPGFSLLLVISVEFTVPIQLGFGFGLVGVGGLIGINHGVDTNQLEAGLHNHAIDNILFPADPVAAAPRIISTLRSVFPITPQVYLFGPLFRIGWPATPFPQMTITLGVILVVPDPVRIILLGQFRIALPLPNAALVDLHADLLGIIDFDQGLISVDVSLNDSRLALYAISGDIVTRVHVKGGGGFLFAAGGFNPHFAIPSDVPPLKRLAIDISGSQNPRVRLEAYLALTSNTFQVGARLELHAAAGSFAIDGWLGFDALVQWNPDFYFIVEISAGITLSYDGNTLVGVTLDFTLSGPGPFDATGRATITILFWDVSVHFHATWGTTDNAGPPPSVELVGTVSQALTLPESWEGQLPAGGDGIVSLVSRDRKGVVVHPLGALTLRQRTAPIGVKLDRLGQAPLKNARRVEFGQATFGPSQTPASGTTPVSDKFAAAQYLDMSDDEKLSRPSFEDFRAGMQLTPAGELVGSVVETDVTYETRILHGPRLLKPPLQLAFAHASAFANLGAAGCSDIAQDSRYTVPTANLPRTPVSVGSVTLTTIASSRSLASADIAVGVTYTLARQAMDRHLADHPEDQERLVLVGAHEVKP